MTEMILLALCVVVAVQNTVAQPADCPRLQEIIPDCSCTSPLDQPNDIVVYCKGKGLTSMPVINGSYLGVIYEFTLAENQITYLPDNAFQDLNVQRVDITGNKLRNISENAFQGLENTLTVLKIGGDPLDKPQAPFSTIRNLRSLQELVLQDFLPPTVDLENSTYFQPFSNLLKLTLDNLGINSIGSQVFIGLTNLREITMNNFLQSYPIGAMQALKSKIEKISVTNSQITVVQQYSFDQFNELKSVDFSYNQINELEDNCFIGVENRLESLTLDNNNVPQAQLRQVGKLAALKFLSLKSIGLDTLTQNSAFLDNKTNLVELNLAGNVLTVIPDNTFKDLSSLKKLELSQNEIQNMADNALAGLTSLETLNLDSQKRSPLTLPQMSSLTVLSTLILDHTVISTPSWDKLRGATSLRTLRMSQCQISAIPAFTFQMMPSLEYVDFSSNQIQDVNQETFVGPRNSLKTIKLGFNRITTFNLCTFNNYSSNISLELLENPLRCDCGLSWLLEAVTNRKIIMTNFAKCASPSGLKDRRFTSLTPSDLCSTTPDVPTCSDYYSTTTSTTTTPSTPTEENIQINVIATDISVNAITVSWTINKLTLVDEVIVVHTDIKMQEEVRSRPLNPLLKDYTVTGLKSGTLYQFCVDANKNGNLVKKECISYTTKTLTTTPDPSVGEQTSNNDELGIIIGSVIGGLLLFGILVAIIYLMVIRKKPPKDKYAVEPRKFTKADLPTTGYDSKRYRKKKKDETDGNKGNVSVTVISDGKSGPNIGRASVGSYQYLQDNKGVSGQPNPHYENNEAVHSNYENDQSMRPLPHMPRDSAGYYSHSPNDTADQQPHTYSEIKL